jgi:hypothetical protein
MMWSLRARRAGPGPAYHLGNPCDNSPPGPCPKTLSPGWTGLLAQQIRVSPRQSPAMHPSQSISVYDLDF